MKDDQKEILMKLYCYTDVMNKLVNTDSMSVIQARGKIAKKGKLQTNEYCQCTCHVCEQTIK